MRKKKIIEIEAHDSVFYVRMWVYPKGSRLQGLVHTLAGGSKEVLISINNIGLKSISNAKVRFKCGKKN